MWRVGAPENMIDVKNARDVECSVGLTMSALMLKTYRIIYFEKLFTVRYAIYGTVLQYHKFS